MKKVKMLTTESGPNGVFRAGCIREVSNAYAEELVSGLYAEHCAPEMEVSVNQQAEEREMSVSVPVRKDKKSVAIKKA